MLRASIAKLLRNHTPSLVLGTFAALAAFVLSNRATAWRWAQNAKVLQVPFRDAPLIQICGSVVFGLTIPLRTGSPAERDDMASGSAPLPCRLAR